MDGCLVGGMSVSVKRVVLTMKGLLYRLLESFVEEFEGVEGEIFVQQFSRNKSWKKNGENREEVPTFAKKIVLIVVLRRNLGPNSAIFCRTPRTKVVDTPNAGPWCSSTRKKSKKNTNRDAFYILKFPKSNGIFVPCKKKLGDERQISGKMTPQPGDSSRDRWRSRNSKLWFRVT